MNDIHVTLNGSIVDLHTLTDDEFAFYMECLSAYKTGMPRADFLRLMQNPDNAMMKGSRFITRDVVNTPLYQVVQDLEYRLSIQQGKLRPSDGDNPDQEPSQTEEFISANQAAKNRGVSTTAIIKAVNEGRIAGHKDGQWKVSVRSLEQYEPDKARQHK